MPTETKSQRLTRQMKKDAERQQRRRVKMATTGKPETHAVDRALAEALAYVVVSHHDAGTKRGAVKAPYKEVLEVASRILAHRGRFNIEQSMRAVVARTRPRDRSWTLGTPTRPQRDDIRTHPLDTPVTSSDVITMIQSMEEAS